MPRVRVKVLSEPKIIEMPAHMQPIQAAPPRPVTPPPAAVTAPAPPPTPVEVAPVARPPHVGQVQMHSRPEQKGLTLTPKMMALSVVGLVIILLFAVGTIKNGGTPESSGTLGIGTTGLSEEERYYQEVSKIVELPSDQLPRVVNISDSEAVKKENAALGDIKNGDKMLFFTKSRKVVVYRPDTKKVVAVVSLATPDNTTSTTPIKN